MRFFFDTADSDAINTLWSKFKLAVDPKAVVGITTNPSAMVKAGCKSLASWKDKVQELCITLNSIRGDNRGVVYMQQPNSNMVPGQVVNYTNYMISGHNGESRIGLKIPPYVPMLVAATHFNEHIEINVTGVADCSTALRALTYDITYVSIIPGRMEEKGINAKEQIAYAQQRKLDTKSIITGSMRTIEGLRWVVQYGTVPTIGTKVLDLVLDEVGADGFVDMWKSPVHVPDQKLSPYVTPDMRSLSVDFFDQMDKLGETAYNEFMVL